MAKLTHTGAQLDAAIRKVRSDFADVSSVDALAKDIREDKKIINNQKQEVIGTMPDAIITLGVVINSNTISDTVTDYPIEITPGGTIDKAGYVDAILAGEVTTKYIKTETKICTPNDTIQEIIPTSGKLLSKVSVRAAPGGGGEIRGYSAVFTEDNASYPYVKFIYLDGSVEVIYANGIYSNVVYVCVCNDYSCGYPYVTGAPLNDFYNGFWLKNDVEYHSWGICLTGDTMITLSDKSVKRLDELELSDEYLSYNLDTGELVKDSAYNLDNIYSRSFAYEKFADRYNICTFDDGTIIKEVHGHRFFNVTKKEFIYLMFWEIGDRIYKIDGTTAELLSMKTIYEPIKFYSISTKTHHNGFANGCLYGDRYTQKYEVDLVKGKPIQNKSKPTNNSILWREKKLKEDATKSWIERVDKK